MSGKFASEQASKESEGQKGKEAKDLGEERRRVTGLDWTGLGWTGRDSAGLGLAGLDRTSLFLRTLNSPSLNAPLLTSCLIALHHGVDQH
jgi:hypothetical protein